MSVVSEVCRCGLAVNGWVGVQWSLTEIPVPVKMLSTCLASFHTDLRLNRLAKKAVVCSGLAFQTLFLKSPSVVKARFHSLWILTHSGLSLANSLCLLFLLQCQAAMEYSRLLIRPKSVQSLFSMRNARQLVITPAIFRERVRIQEQTQYYYFIMIQVIMIRDESAHPLNKSQTLL